MSLVSAKAQLSDEEPHADRDGRAREICPAVREIGRGALGLTAFRCLVNDPRFQDTIGVLETPVPERYADALQLLHSLVRT